MQMEELKKKREELGTGIEALRGEIAILEQQRAAFDTVLKVYEESYCPDGAVRIEKASEGSSLPPGSPKRLSSTIDVSKMVAAEIRRTGSSAMRDSNELASASSKAIATMADVSMTISWVAHSRHSQGFRRRYAIQNGERFPITAACC